MSKLVGLSCLLFLRATYVASLSLCDASNYLEVKEGRSSTFYCTGLTAQPDVYFYWGTSYLLSSCTATRCSNDEYPQYFQFSRTNITSTKATVDPSTYPDLNSLATTSLSCQQGSDSNKVTCQLDVVYPAEDPKCQIEFSGETWEVTGWCNVSKALSRRNRYGCYLYQTSQQSSSSLVSNVTMSTIPTTGTVYCQFKTALPPEGKYNYSVIIIPGGVEVFPSFNGSNEIQRPSVSPQHTCPQTVNEGEDVDCVCISDRLGFPSGYVMWTRTNSPKLTIKKVNRSYHDTSNVCVLMWNNTAVQNVTYTIVVNYASRVISFQIDNNASDVVNVNENRNISVVCQAEGRPLSKISLYKRGNNQNITISDADNVNELRYAVHVVNCEEAYTYFCKSENNISSDQRSIRLVVSCSPKKTTNDSYLTTFANGEASLTFKMMAYPPPSLLSIFYNGSATNSTFQKVEHEKTVRSTCSSDTPYSSIITCTVTLLNETIYAIGFYTVTFSNALGNISFSFVVEKLQTTTNTMEITVPEADKSTNYQTALGAGLGAGLGLACVVVIVLVVIIVRLRKMVLRRHYGNSYSGPVQNSSVNTDQEHVYGEIPIKDINSQSSYQNIQGLNGDETTPNTDQDAYHIYEVPKDENIQEPGQEDVYSNKAFS